VDRAYWKRQKKIIMDRKNLETRRGFLKKSSLAVGVIAAGNACSKSVSNSDPDYSIPENGFHGKPENRREWSGDIRSGKVVFVAHCVLNQNARMIDVADFPAMHDQLLDYLQKAQIGIIQMACPETYCLGLGRFDVRVGLEHPAGMERLQRLIDDLIFTIREYLFQGMEVVAVIGKEGSPSCGVKQTWYNEGGHGDGQGVFIRELKEKLALGKLDIPVIGVADYKQEDVIDCLEKQQIQNSLSG
jgi:predicted secreted protein